MEKKQTAVDWLYEKIKSHFEHDGDLFESVATAFSVAKLKEREQIEEAYKKGGENFKNSYFDDEQDFITPQQYYTQTFNHA